MRKSIGILGLALFAASSAEAATVSGAVTGPDGKPFRAAFVQAFNAKLKMTLSVLSDNEGKYVVENLPAGSYRVSIRAIGYKADSKSGLSLAADDKTSHDFALQKGMVRWTEISQLQGFMLMPEDRGKKVLFENCMGCHGFQSRMAATVRDEDGWRSRVEFMREAMKSSLADRRGFSDQQAEDVTYYINRLFGEDSVLPKSPADHPAYAGTVFNPSDEALKIVYVDYEMPGPTRFPWTSHGDKDGNRWTPEYGVANKVMRFNPQTTEMKEFSVPNLGPALIHSAVPAPDGSVWITEAGAKKLGRWDPKTEKFTEYQDTWRKHTIKIAPDGRVWSTGGLSVFDPKTEKFTHIPEVPTAYGITIDKQENIWATEMTMTGFLDKIDPKTLKVTKYIPPTRGKPRRIQIDDDGMLWFCVFEDGKIDRFDPKTETFKEFALPNAKSHPYALGIGLDRSLWYSSESRDVIGQLNPDTGKVVEYPMPYSDNGMRDFFLDKEGRVWYGSPPNNKVGYFYLSNRQRSADVR